VIHPPPVSLKASARWQRNTTRCLSLTNAPQVSAGHLAACTSTTTLSQTSRLFGKTLGNGYAITAIIGRESVMQAAQQTFISSTFWTERIGPTAALATLKVMEETNAPQRVHEIGIQVQQQWEKLGADAGLTVTAGGLPALANFAVSGLDPLAVKTYITSRMLDQGYLAGNSLYVSLAHTDAILDQYYEALAIVFAELAQMDDTQLASALPNGPPKPGSSV